MDIRQIEYFVEVAKQLSFTKAATTLHVSQPSISKAIQNFEAELGVPLFYRSSKQLELTDAGQAVLINSMQVLESFQNLRSELTDLMQLKKGQIRIGIPPIVGAEFFSRLISVYKEHNPYIEILLTEVGTKRIREEIETGELDIGLVCSVTSTNENLETIRFLKDPLQLIVHESHPLAQKQTISMGDLANEAFIIYRKDFILFDRIIEECKKHNFYPTIACETTQKDLFIEMVQAKLGIALLPQKIAEKIPYESIKCIPFTEEEIHLELGITWKKNKYLPYSVREFIQLAHQFVLQ
ncbi:LysR family transcriptional regulator [Lysinibacillus sp. 2017]|uniref:LysR family transcriptional regulator n=1 Tax=unclassified Lysinibacillus TaxID=2636778 RepID=UPI000D525B55|nr:MULTISPECIES: LysR family transcriptional regulator [unclassified Lysinibacillus]AWE09092.1 LysR family transcriptional regulator [Lysinibacillus sp. 2017]TGN35916.1 LysR family transcriptional regulator [Lysinibacillus sp. S2017]